MDPGASAGHAEPQPPLACRRRLARWILPAYDRGNAGAVGRRGRLGAPADPPVLHVRVGLAACSASTLTLLRELGQAQRARPFFPRFGWLTVGPRACRRRRRPSTYGWAASAGIGAAPVAAGAPGPHPVARGGGVARRGVVACGTSASRWACSAILYGQGTSYNTGWSSRATCSALLIFTAFMCSSRIWMRCSLFRQPAGGRNGIHFAVVLALAAFLWFPWMYATANLAACSSCPMQAAAKSIAGAAWYAHSLITTVASCPSRWRWPTTSSPKWWAGPWRTTGWHVSDSGLGWCSRVGAARTT